MPPSSGAAGPGGIIVDWLKQLLAIEGAALDFLPATCLL